MAETERPKMAADEAGFEQVLKPFLKSHCIGCHGPAAQEGEFRVDVQLVNDFLDPVAKGKWGEVVNVLNSHEMPPEDETQPQPDEVAKVVDWIARQMARAELHRRDSAIVLRRINRAEYRNTIRDLIGIDFDTAGFPQDPPAGGFDNNGGALTTSPLHLELYYNAARKILDRALVEGPRPSTIKWRFQPESGDSDSNRVNYDGQRLIVNGGNNPSKDGFKILHHERWDKKLNARTFKLPHDGEYVIRIRAAGVVPTRDQVVASARPFLQQRMDKDIQKNPTREKYARRAFDDTLQHFQTDRMYDYGAARMKLIRHLGGQPAVLAELDVDATLKAPKVFEVRARFSTDGAGLTIEYAYDIPKELENFWFQTGDDFARPELWVDWFEIEGPLHPAWPPRSHSRILFESPLQETDERAYAREVLARFMPRAWRRPVTGDEIDEKLRLFDTVRPQAPSFVSAIKTPLVAAMISPSFLFLAEPEEQATAPGQHVARRLNDHELAGRLSYFLWSSMPDAELARLADAGGLSDPRVLAAQVERMLPDAKCQELVRNFAGQWLGLREVGANPPAQDLYRRYDRHLEISIVEESLAFFREVLRSNLSVMNFVRSDFVMINERLGRFYGIPGVRGDHFRRVPVPDGVHRGGILTQASILSTTSNGTRTSPVKRGTWVMKNVLGIDPGLPVANAGEIAPKVPGLDKATVRQRLEIHRSLPQCARCHNKIDPLGFALENYDASGDWREREGHGYKGRIGANDPMIDASSKLLDGTEINGIDSLQEALMARQDLFLKCLAGKMMTYALGRELGIADQLHVNACVDHLKTRGDTMKSLIQFIVASEPFRSK
ncbi:MAG: DUF1592 domain-containing protein [Planctomycetota bacterium]|nr:DUF1592 domain-containing protein [Planctomycetota bacterium]